ncbi:formylglycine-generating enzyme family protein [Nitrincola sp. MINF-07-Sa-05]|uniref:formylglycine-generating enzyme family protein n=1 Tax=Nitrincola salilacus TaxID=3400273 RepID=UPI0039184024
MNKAALLIAATLFSAGALSAQAAESTNKYGITMVDIPAGSFLMGSCKVTAAMQEENKKRAFLGQPALSTDCASPDKDASDNETPQHRVSIKAFQMGRTEVTLGQFKKFISDAGRTNLLSSDFMKYNNRGDNAPVVYVSWNDAQAFIDWLNLVDGSGWRLPSEAEWEYACRANTGYRFCTSANDLSGGGWWDGNSGGRQHPVALKEANAFGLYDMSGNAWEWVQDCWHNSYSGAPTDGSAWTRGCDGDGRVLRGGYWSDSPWYSRAAYRYNFTPGNRYNYGGFRLARTR